MQAAEEFRRLVLDVLPDQGRWAAEQYLALTDGSQRPVELVRHALEFPPMPTDLHQAVLELMHGWLKEFVRAWGGVARIAPLRVRISEGTYREPDVAVLLDARDPRRQNRAWLGADLVVEVVSPEAPDRDYVDKRRDYGAAGILEYWIIDPEKARVTILGQPAGDYRSERVFAPGAAAPSALLDGFAVDVATLLAAD